jgi:uncharacterized cupredoxin-like copper-binding protein
VTRALEKMRLLLRRRGITSTSLALGSALVLARTAEAPGGLAQAVAAGALQAAPASAAAGLASLAWWAKAAMGLGLVAVVGIPVRHWMAEQPVAVLAETPVAVRPVVVHQAPPVVAGRSRLDGLGQPLFPPAPAPVSVPATVPVPVPAVPSFPEPPLEMTGQTTALVVPVPDTGEIAKLMLGVVPEVMKFFPETFSVKAGQRVMILFKNEKCPLQHNFLLVNPGKLAEVGALADQMLTDPQAMAKLYVPDSPDILAEGTKLLGIGQSDLVEFTAPAEPGEYPFLCTFPGHWRLMNGILTVSP